MKVYSESQAKQLKCQTALPPRVHTSEDTNMTDYRYQCFDCNKNVDLKTTRCLECQRKHLLTKPVDRLIRMPVSHPVNNPERDPDGWGSP